MKYIFFIILMLAIAACSNEAPNTQVENIPESNEQTTHETNTESLEETKPLEEIKLGNDASGDCSLLTTEDINEVCQVTTELEPQEAKDDEICRTRFVKEGTTYADRIYQSVTFRYKDDLPQDPQLAIEKSIERIDAERLSQNAMFSKAAGDWAIIYGSKYRVTIHNTMPGANTAICTAEQIKELGKLVSERI